MIEQKIGEIPLFSLLSNRILIESSKELYQVYLSVEPDWNMDEEVLTENHRATTAHLLSTELLANSRKQFKLLLSGAQQSGARLSGAQFAKSRQSLCVYVCKYRNTAAVSAPFWRDLRMNWGWRETYFIQSEHSCQTIGIPSTELQKYSSCLCALQVRFKS